MLNIYNYISKFNNSTKNYAYTSYTSNTYIPTPVFKKNIKKYHILFYKFNDSKFLDNFKLSLLKTNRAQYIDNILDYRYIIIDIDLFKEQ